MLTALFISTIISFFIIAISFFILYNVDFFKRNRLLLLSIISWYALWNAIFVSAPWIILMIWANFLDILCFWAIIFTILLSPILKLLSEQHNQEEELDQHWKNIFFISMLWFLWLHTLAEAITIWMTHSFFTNINIWEVFLNVIHEAPEVAFIASLYYFYTKEKEKTYNLVFLIWILYPIWALITSALVTHYNPWFFSYIKAFLLWWYIVFATISLYILWNAKNRWLYISIFLFIIIIMFLYKIFVWIM